MSRIGRLRLTFTIVYGTFSSGATRCPRGASGRSAWKRYSGTLVSRDCAICGGKARCREPVVKPVGKPDAGNPPVRFDERGGETDRFGDTAPLLDSTGENRGAAIRCVPNQLASPGQARRPGIGPRFSTTKTRRARRRQVAAALPAEWVASQTVASHAPLRPLPQAALGRRALVQGARGAGGHRPRPRFAVWGATEWKCCVEGQVAQKACRRGQMFNGGKTQRYPPNYALYRNEYPPFPRQIGTICEILALKVES